MLAAIGSFNRSAAEICPRRRRLRFGLLPCSLLARVVFFRQARVYWSVATLALSSYL